MRAGLGARTSDFYGWRPDGDRRRRTEGDREDRQHASREVLQDQAFGTVVIRGMRGTARNRRHVDGMLVVIVAGGVCETAAAMRAAAVSVRMRIDTVVMRTKIVDEIR